jgi:DMSO reductase family type II enzyme chaperone
MSASLAAFAFARAAAYRLLAASLAYPTPEALARIADARPAAAAARRHVAPPSARALDQLIAALGVLAPEEAERAYLRVFGHAGTPAAAPYEAAYVTTNVFQETEVLAEVAGFYRAFGVVADRERPDHVALELEFAHLLCFKEGYARRHHGPAEAAICAEAQRAFLATHLGRWAATFFRRLRASADRTHYALVADLGEAFCAGEATRAGAVAIARAPRVPDAPEPGVWSCPLAPEPSA